MQVQQGFFFSPPVNKVSFIVDLYHGAHQPLRDFEVLEDVQDVHLLIHRLWVTDVSDVNQQVLFKYEEGKQVNTLYCGTSHTHISDISVGYIQSV